VRYTLKGVNHSHCDIAGIARASASSAFGAFARLKRLCTPGRCMSAALRATAIIVYFSRVSISQPGHVPTSCSSARGKRSSGSGRREVAGVSREGCGRRELGGASREMGGALSTDLTSRRGYEIIL